MTIHHALRAVAVVQYDGTNSAEITAAIDATEGMDFARVVSETGGTLVLEWSFAGGAANTGGEGVETAHTGDWVQFQVGWVTVIPAAQFAEQWIIKPTGE